jgi:calcineurin-like phosphoesterase
MKIPEWIAPAVFGIIFSLQGWTLIEIVNLKVDVATIVGRMNMETEKQNIYEQNKNTSLDPGRNRLLGIVP